MVMYRFKPKIQQRTSTTTKRCLALAIVSFLLAATHFHSSTQLPATASPEHPNFIPDTQDAAGTRHEINLGPKANTAEKFLVSQQPHARMLHREIQDETKERKEQREVDRLHSPIDILNAVTRSSREYICYTFHGFIVSCEDASPDDMKAKETLPRDRISAFPQALKEKFEAAPTKSIPRKEERPCHFQNMRTCWPIREDADQEFTSKKINHESKDVSTEESGPNTDNQPSDLVWIAPVSVLVGLALLIAIVLGVYCCTRNRYRKLKDKFGDCKLFSPRPITPVDSRPMSEILTGTSSPCCGVETNGELDGDLPVYEPRPQDGGARINSRTADVHEGNCVGLDGISDGWTKWIVRSCKRGNKVSCNSSVISPLSLLRDTAASPLDLRRLLTGLMSTLRAPKRYSPKFQNEAPRLPSLQLSRATLSTVRSSSGIGPGFEDMISDKRVKWGSTV